MHFSDRIMCLCTAIILCVYRYRYNLIILRKVVTNASGKCYANHSELLYSLT